jgi:hypothetical protein
MDNGKFLRLLHINQELIEICHWLNENQNTTLASRLIPLSDELTNLVHEMSMEK